MALEIERKYLIEDPPTLLEELPRKEIIQGFLQREKDQVVRVRLTDGKGTLTIKFRVPGSDTTRREYEYPIPAEDAREILSCCVAGVRKVRYLHEYRGHTWEIDVFAGQHEGLVLAEIELPTEDTPFEKPDYIGRDVTGDPEYMNANLATPGFMDASVDPESSMEESSLKQAP